MEEEVKDSFRAQNIIETNFKIIGLHEYQLPGDGNKCEDMKYLLNVPS